MTVKLSSLVIVSSVIASCGTNSTATNPEHRVLASPTTADESSNFSNDRSSENHPPIKTGISLDWRTNEDIAFSDAKRLGKGVMIDFEASWCMPCKALGTIFEDASVAKAVQTRFVLLKFDVSESNDRDEALQKRYNAASLPAVLFLDADGTELMRYTNVAPTAFNVLAAIEQAEGMLGTP